MRLVEHVQRRTPLRLLAVVEFAQIKELPLMNAPARADTFHDAPVAVLLAVLQSLVASQVHAPIFPQKTEPSTGKVCTTAYFGTRPLENKG